MKSKIKTRIRRGIVALVIAATATGGVLASALSYEPTQVQEEVVLATALYSVLTTLPSPTPIDEIDTERRVTVLVNGGTEPRAFYGENRDGVTYVTVRELAEAFGAAVELNADGVTVITNDVSFKISLGDKYFKAGGKYVYLAAEAQVQNGELVAPIRALTDALDAEIGWNNEFRTVLVAPPQSAEAAAAFAGAPYTEEDLLWMARIICAEARGESFEGKLAVGNVVMNRIASDAFPNSVYDVIFDGIQFTPAITGAIYNTPPEDCYAAADIALRNGADIVGASLYFANTTRCWAARVREYFGSVGSHYFYI